jgi:hypothetical protein
LLPLKLLFDFVEVGREKLGIEALFDGVKPRPRGRMLYGEII